MKKVKHLNIKKMTSIAMLVSLGYILVLLRFAFPPALIWFNPELPFIAILIAAFIYSSYIPVLLITLLICPFYFFTDMMRGIVVPTTALCIFLDYLIPMLLCSFTFFFRDLFYKKLWTVIPVYIIVAILILFSHTLSGILTYKFTFVASILYNLPLLPNSWIILTLVAVGAFKVIKTKRWFEYSPKKIKKMEINKI